MDNLLSAADPFKNLTAKIGEVGREAEMPLRFQFHAETLWRGRKSPANPVERRAVLWCCA
jgi:hypothetical protein